MKQWSIFKQTMRVMGKDCPAYLLGIFFMSTCWAAFSVMTSILLKNVVDAAQSAQVNRIPWIIAGNILGGVVILLLYRAGAIVYNVEAKRAYGTICKKVFHHEVRLPYAYYEKHHSGEFISKLSYDLEKMGSIYGSRLRRTVAPILQVIVYLIPMMILSWQITFCLIGVNLIMLLINGLLIKPIREVSKELSETNSKMTEKMSNLLQGMEQARMYRAGLRTVDEFVSENEKYVKQNNKKIVYTAILESCSNGFDLLCALAFLMLGIYFVQSGQTTLGSLTAIYSLYGTFSFQFLQLGRYLPELIGCLVNAQNIFEFLEEEEEPENWYGKDASKADGAMIHFDGIEFCYREDKPLLKDFSMRVTEGESVAITGPSGSGKTTVSKLLLSLYPVIGGEWFLNGKSCYNLSNSEIRSQIAYVPQEPYLFHESIKENIRIGKPDATDKEIVNAAKMAYAHEFIMQLENGYDTNVGAAADGAEAGQRLLSDHRW